MYASSTPVATRRELTVSEGEWELVNGVAKVLRPSRSPSTMAPAPARDDRRCRPTVHPEVHELLGRGNGRPVR